MAPTSATTTDTTNEAVHPVDRSKPVPALPSPPSKVPSPPLSPPPSTRKNPAQSSSPFSPRWQDPSPVSTMNDSEMSVTRDSPRRTEEREDGVFESDPISPRSGSSCSMSISSGPSPWIQRRRSEDSGYRSQSAQSVQSGSRESDDSGYYSQEDEEREEGSVFHLPSNLLLTPPQSPTAEDGIRRESVVPWTGRYTTWESDLTPHSHGHHSTAPPNTADSLVWTGRDWTPGFGFSVERQDLGVSFGSPLASSTAVASPPFILPRKSTRLVSWPLPGIQNTNFIVFHASTPSSGEAEQPQTPKADSTLSEAKPGPSSAASSPASGTRTPSSINSSTGTIPARRGRADVPPVNTSTPLSTGPDSGSDAPQSAPVWCERSASPWSLSPERKDHHTRLRLALEMHNMMKAQRAKSEAGGE